MERMSVGSASNAVSSMQALRASLAEDLEDIEHRIHELAQSPAIASEDSMREMQVYYVARAALYSGLESINEVLGWVRLMAPSDAEGNAPAVVRDLPTVAVFSIH